MASYLQIDYIKNYESGVHVLVRIISIDKIIDYI